MDGVQTTRVEIFGTEYSVRADAGAEEQYVKDIAAYVDAKMKEISKQQKLVSSTKIAILAAINLADEVFQQRHRHDEDNRSASAKVIELSNVLAREM